MRKPGLLILVFFVALALALPALAQEQQKPTLYKRIGGYDTIAAVVDSFLMELAKEPKLSRFTQGLSTTSRKRNRQLITDQICNLTGGPCLYIGRTMPAAHEGLGITEDDWERSGKLMSMALDKNKISGADKDEFLTIIGKLKDDIVAKKAPAK